jgi:hypothetical protein
MAHNANINEEDRKTIKEIGELAWETAVLRTTALLNEDMPDFGWSSKDAIGKQVWTKHHSQAILEQCKVLERIARMKKGELGRENFGGDDADDQRRLEDMLNQVMERRNKRDKTTTD